MERLAQEAAVHHPSPHRNRARGKRARIGRDARRAHQSEIGAPAGGGVPFRHAVGGQSASRRSRACRSCPCAPDPRQSQRSDSAKRRARSCRFQRRYPAARRSPRRVVALRHARLAPISKARTCRAPISRMRDWRTPISPARICAVPCSIMPISPAPIFRQADLSGARLHNVRNLLTSQLEETLGDAATILPSHLRGCVPWSAVGDEPRSPPPRPRRILAAASAARSAQANVLRPNNAGRGRSCGGRRGRHRLRHRDGARHSACRPGRGTEKCRANSVRAACDG